MMHAAVNTAGYAASSNANENRRVTSFHEYVRELASFRDDPQVWSSALEFLAALSRDEQETIGLVLLVPGNPVAFRERMIELADEVGLSVRDNIAFQSKTPCSIEAIWRMPVVLAELLSNKAAGWNPPRKRPVNPDAGIRHYTPTVLNKHTGELMGVPYPSRCH